MRPIFEDPYAEADQIAAAEAAQYSFGPEAHGAPYPVMYRPPPPHYPPNPYFGQAPPSAPTEERGWAHTKVGPFPIWGWVLALAAAAGGYYYYKNKKTEVAPNSPEPDQQSEPEDEDEQDDHRSRGGWCPSRTRVAERLEGYLKSKRKDAAVYSDASEAKRHVSKPSPLITLKPNRGSKLDPREIDRMTRREGLYAVAADDGSIGLYPTAGTKRGKEWEDYIDELRDNGQEI